MKVNIVDDSRYELSETDIDDVGTEIPKGHKLTLQDQIDSKNLCDYLGPRTLMKLGSECLENFNLDYASRAQLNENLRNEIDLAMQISGVKSTPFSGASNVKFPLVTTAVLQYASRAMAGLYNNGRLVEARPPSGADKRDPKKREACSAVEKDMAFGLITLDQSWDDSMRKTLVAQAVTGNVFKKIYFDTETQRVVSEPIFLDKMIFSSYTTDFNKCNRKSIICHFDRNGAFTKQASGEWRGIKAWDGSHDNDTPVDETLDNRHGQEKDRKTEVDPDEFIEMYTVYDLDDDGYMEPLIITFRRVDGFIVRVVANFHDSDIKRNKSKELLCITPEVVIVKYGFIPSPGDSPYDFGYARILYGINHAVNTGINQILDTAKWSASGPVGLMDMSLGSQLAGKNQFQPGEWKQAKILGIDMSKAIWAAPQPSVNPESLQLISLLIQYADRISGSTEARAGENPGQNTKVGTVEALISEGATIFNGVFRGTRRAFCQELRAIFRLKKRYFSDLSRTVDEEEMASQEQYDMISDINPACSLQYISERDSMQKATTALQVAAQFPTAHRIDRILQDFYDSTGPEDADNYLIRDPKSPTGIPQAPNPQVQIEQAKIQQKQQDSQGKLQVEQAKIQQEAQKDQQDTQLKAQELQAEIKLKEAQVLSLLSGIDDNKMGHKIAMLDAVIGIMKHKDVHGLKVLDMINQQSENTNGQDDTNATEGMDGQPGNAGVSQ